MTIVDITLAPKRSATACGRGGCFGNESAASGLRGHVVVTGQHYSCNAQRRVRALLGLPVRHRGDDIARHVGINLRQPADRMISFGEANAIPDFVPSPNGLASGSVEGK